MLEKIKIELKAIFLFLKNNYSSIIIMSAATLFLTMAKYFSLRPPYFSAFFYYFILPVLVIIILLRKNPLDFGLRLGNYRIWGIHVLVAAIITIIVIFIASRDSSLQKYYSSKNLDILSYIGQYTVKLFAWEFLFRGFMVIGLKEKYEEGSIVIQMVPFVIMHFSKPMIEILTCIPMGLYFGFVAYRGNSFWPAFLIHMVINISLKVFVNYF